jgi:hypothetical protein
MPIRMIPNRRTVACIATCMLAMAARWGRAGQPATAPATTQAAASQPADADVAVLIRQLGADEEADRADAQEQLVDLGTTATDALRAAAEHDGDPEVRSRSAAALAQIRDRDSNGPTLVTLHVRGGDVPTVLGQIGRQAHADISDPIPNFGGPGGASLTLDADRRPFWDVMGDVCGQLNVCPLLTDSPNHGAFRLIPTSRNWMTGGPHEVVGPFWVGVAGLYRLTSVDLAGPPVTADTFLARLIVFPEPKLVVTQISPLAVRTATDDAGNSLVVPAGATAARLVARTAGRVPARTVEARLQYPAEHAGRRIATLAGDLTVTLAQGAQRFEADDVLARPTVTRPLPGVKVRVAVTHSGPSMYYQVTVECTRDGLADAQWYAMTNRVNDLTVEDGTGHALLPAMSWNVDAGNTDTSFKATCLFGRTVAGNLLMNRIAAVGGGVGNNPAAAAVAPPGEPAKIVWNVAARFKVVTVPVAFHDLPMP